MTSGRTAPAASGRPARPLPTLTLILTVTVALLLGVTLWAPPATAAARQPTTPAPPAPTPAAARPEWPQATPLTEPAEAATAPQPLSVPRVRAEAYLLADAETGQVLASRNADQPRAMASTTKVMTGMLALERLDPDRVVTIGSGPTQVGEAGLGLRVRERLTVRQLLTGLLVRSANDAAVALAEAADGSVGSFVHRMNHRARQLGLTRTRYANPHGLDARGHHTSTRDLARLWLTALQHPVFAELAGTRTARLPGPPASRRIQNTNELLGAYRWVDGGKTGFTDAAGHCLVVSARRGGRHLVAVALDSTDTFADLHALLEHGFAAYVRARVADDDTGIPLPGGAGELQVAGDVDALVRRDLLDEVTISPTPAAGGRRAARLAAGEQVLGHVPLAGDPAAGAGAAGRGGDPAAGGAEPLSVPLQPDPVPAGAAVNVIDPFLGVQSQSATATSPADTPD